MKLFRNIVILWLLAGALVFCASRCHGQMGLRSGTFVSVATRPVSGALSYVLKDSYDGDDNYDNVGSLTAQTYKSSSWTTGSAYNIGQVDLEIYRVGTASAYPITVSIFANASDKPTGSALATSTNTVLHSDLGTSAAYVSFRFPPVALSAATIYHIVISQGTVDAANYTRFRIDQTSGPAGQHINRSEDASTWTLYLDNVQASFKTYALE